MWPVSGTKHYHWMDCYDYLIIMSGHVRPTLAFVWYFVRSLLKIIMDTDHMPVFYNLSTFLLLFHSSDVNIEAKNIVHYNNVEWMRSAREETRWIVTSCTNFWKNNESHMWWLMVMTRLPPISISEYNYKNRKLSFGMATLFGEALWLHVVISYFKALYFSIAINCSPSCGVSFTR